MAQMPIVITYSSVVTRETVCIPLTMALFHDVEAKAADMLDTDVTAPSIEKLWTVLGSEFGDNAGKCAIIFRALYGLKSACTSVRSHFA